MRIVVIGLGKVGRALTAQLTAENNDIVVIDQNPELIEDIVNIYDVRGVPGNGGCYEVQKEAFEDGADAVYVVGCPAEGCHNVKGSLRAAKRVDSVRKALAEMGVEADRVRMYHLERGLHPEFIAAAEEMNTLISRLGKSPFCRKAA